MFENKAPCGAPLAHTSPENLPGFVILGGAKRDRTVDLRTASATLSQLSYSPKKWLLFFLVLFLSYISKALIVKAFLLKLNTASVERSISYLFDFIRKNPLLSDKKSPTSSTSRSMPK